MYGAAQFAVCFVRKDMKGGVSAITISWTTALHTDSRSLLEKGARDKDFMPA